MCSGRKGAALDPLTQSGLLCSIEGIRKYCQGRDSYEIWGALEGLILVWTKWPWVQGLMDRPFRTHTVPLAGELYWSAGEGPAQQWVLGSPGAQVGEQMHQEIHQSGLERWDSIVKMGSTSSQQRPGRGQPGPKSHTGFQPETSRDIGRTGSFAYSQQPSGEAAGEWGGAGVLGQPGWGIYPIGMISLQQQSVDC